MSRREYMVRATCAVCGKNEFRICDTRKAERALRKRLSSDGHRCTRHSRPDEVLSRENNELSYRITAGRSRKHPDLKEMFWDTATESGFAYGHRWKAWARDFPEGTQIAISIRVVMPEERGEGGSE